MSLLDRLEVRQRVPKQAHTDKRRRHRRLHLTVLCHCFDVAAACLTTLRNQTSVADISKKLLLESAAALLRLRSATVSVFSHSIRTVARFAIGQRTLLRRRSSCMNWLQTFVTAA